MPAFASLGHCLQVRNRRLHNASRLPLVAIACAVLLLISLGIFGLEYGDGGVQLRWAPFLPSPSSPPSPPPSLSPPSNPVDSRPPELHGNKNQDNVMDYRILTSKRNSRGFFNIVSTENAGVEIFNPTLLELPSDCEHQFLIIGRSLHRPETIEGVEYKRSQQLAVFANMTEMELGSPQLISGTWSKSLVEDFAGPEHHCKGEPDMDKYIGPEDMKVFWTRTGAPLLIFTGQTPDENLCEGMYLVDARAAIPELAQVLGERANMPPIIYKRPILLRREPPSGHEADERYQREKNWAPIQSPFGQDQSLFFMVEPSELFKLNHADKPLKQVDAQHNSAVQGVHPPGAQEAWHSDRTCAHDVMHSADKVHQSTPMLSLTLCNRGECEPNTHNTVLLGMVQRRVMPEHAAWYYQRRIVAYNATAPYNMVSVSKALSYHGEKHGQFIWTGSMVYFMNSTDLPKDRGHGYLDDEVRLSFGVQDTAPGWLDIDARELIMDHYFCEGATQYALPIDG